MRKRLLYIVLLVCVAAHGRVPIEHPNLGEPTGIAPAYFGPNAFPVPDMLDGRTQSHLRVEVAGDGYFGYEGDWTADVFARVYIPLFTERVNLTLWMPVQEWYAMTPERQRTCRLQDMVPMTGHEAGDVYVSTDIQVWKARKWSPDVMLRAAIKTASGGSFEKARYYDNPGYFFDLSVGKSLYFGAGKQFPYADAADAKVELRFAGSAGFLCWQTDNGRQNDAVMYGLQMLLRSEYVSLRATWNGYVGWENDGDRPMVVKARLAGHAKGFEPFAEYQYGIKDYPFHMVRVGLAYHINVPALTKGGKR
ncbi:MAG: hypothetical protein ACI30A_01185 [Paludibacteraceae bacterium]